MNLTKTAPRRLSLVTCLALFGLVGCERAEPLQFVSSEQVLGLEDELRSEVEKYVRDYTGSATTPKMLGDDEFDPDQLAHGQAVYMKRCAQCHGVSGDGKGPVAGSLYPRPRDYRRGIFKFTSTPYGSKPKRSDLEKTLIRGVPGTSMPSFDRLSKKDLKAVVDYILMLTHRGELEYQLGSEAENEEELDPEYVPEYAEGIVDDWHTAQYQTVRALTPQPEFTAENVEAGRKAFLSKGCSKCHAEDGRGHMPGNIGKDTWGFTTSAADLTSGMLRGGQRPEDIYQRIYSGINGTPMPAFKNTLGGEPETIWNLVAYVLYVSNSRRNGALPPAGMLKPYPTAASSSEAASDEDSEDDDE
ncbi:MAG: cytochrome c [Planctomycetaceae bacterium]